MMIESQSTAAGYGGRFVCGAALREQEKAAASCGGFFVRAVQKGRDAKSSLVASACAGSAQDAEGVQHSEGEQAHHEQAGDYHVRIASRGIFRGHEFQGSFQFQLHAMRHGGR
jgi:hypothetical protein